MLKIILPILGLLLSFSTSASYATEISLNCKVKLQIINSESKKVFNEDIPITLNIIDNIFFITGRSRLGLSISGTNMKLPQHTLMVDTSSIEVFSSFFTYIDTTDEKAAVYISLNRINGILEYSNKTPSLTYLINGLCDKVSRKF